MLSTSHLTSVRGVVKKLEEQRTRNMRTVMEACEKLDRSGVSGLWSSQEGRICHSFLPLTPAPAPVKPGLTPPPAACTRGCSWTWGRSSTSSRRTPATHPALSATYTRSAVVMQTFPKHMSRQCKHSLNTCHDKSCKHSLNTCQDKSCKHSLNTRHVNIRHVNIH